MGTAAALLAPAVGAAVAPAATTPTTPAVTTPPPSPGWTSIPSQVVSKTSASRGTSLYGSTLLPDGTARVVWQDYGRTDAETASIPVMVGTLDAAGTLTSSVPLSRPVDPPLSFDRTGAAFALESDARRYSTQNLGWVTIKADGTVSKRHVLSPYKVALPPRFATNARGDAVVVWDEFFGKGTRIRAALRAAGGDFGKPITLGTLTDSCCSEAAEVEASVNATGRVVIAYGGNLDPKGYDGPRVVWAWTGTTRALRKTPRVVGRSQGNTDFSTAVDGKGRAYVGWGSQSAGEEVDGPRILRVASIGPSDAHFGAVRTVDSGIGTEKSDERSYEVPSIVAYPSGGALVSWQATGKAHGGPTVMRIAASGGFHKAQRLSASGYLGGMAIRKDGTAVATYAAGTPSVSYAVFAKRGAVAFGKPEVTGFRGFAGPDFDRKTGQVRLIDILSPDATVPDGAATLEQAVRTAP
jgi:hypothetical protein